MRELAVLSFVTLDGVMQAPGSPEEDPSHGFDQGGWAAPFWDGVMPHVERTAMAEPYDIVFGRKTYDLFAGYWPNAPASGVSQRLNAARKYVATSNPATKGASMGWHNTHALQNDAANEVRKLKSQDSVLLQVHGSAQLIQTLLAHDLIDEFRIWTFPVLVGSGKRLFEGSHPQLNLQLVTAGVLDNGVTAQVYRRTVTRSAA